jgi:hypothetical protein
MNDEWLVQLIRQTPENFSILTQDEMNDYLSRALPEVDVWVFGKSVRKNMSEVGPHEEAFASTISGEDMCINKELIGLFTTYEEEDSLI